MNYEIVRIEERPELKETAAKWEFLCMVQGDGEPTMTRMYIHKG